ncbi:MAG TPA: urease accessory protein UreE [Desulfobacterales bacterium]|nr:urease accessory protein UreE [Desulfobacterales bacterium]
MIQLTQKDSHCKKAITTLTLPWGKRTKSRQRVLLDTGEEAGLFLERGVILRGGDIISNADNFTVQIHAAKETLSLVFCENSLQLSRLCYHLGNRHVDLQISSDHLCYPHDHVLDEMIMGLGFSPVKLEAPFEPETGAYSDGGHCHSHHHE